MAALLSICMKEEQTAVVRFLSVERVKGIEIQALVCSAWR
jgi:hypothetical protein